MASLLKIFVLLAVALASTLRVQAETDDFDDRVRQFLLENPEVILEALEQLSLREQEAALAGQIAQFPDLFARPAVLGMGDANARIRAVEFFDYKCVPCKAVHGPLEAIVADHPQLRIEMRHLPILTPASERATRFAFAVWAISGAEAYAEAHALLWDHTGPYNTGFFDRVSESLALDFAQIEEVMWSEKITTQIDENRDIAIALEIVGTPAFVTPKGISVGSTDVTALKDLFLSQ